MALETLFLERIIQGLRRKTLTSCSKWAVEYRVMGSPFPGKFSFKQHPWIKEPHDSKSENKVAKKAAQMGFTELALNKTFYNIDVKRVNCLYILPSKVPDASDFSSARFDAALELSEHLSKLFSDTKNIGHKRAGTTNLYIRGSKSRSGLKSLPVGFVVFDELDEMLQENIPLALERMSGQTTKETLKISTPTINGYGIDKEFIDSTQERFHFHCPKCSRIIELRFPESLIITADDLNDPKVKDSHLICTGCKATLEHATKTEWMADGLWVPQKTNMEASGYEISQLYSTTVSPVELGKSYLKSLNDRAEEQEFHNSKLGVAHIVEGAQINDADIGKVFATYSKNDVPARGGWVTMGVDVGKWLHCEIDQWQLQGTIGSDLNALAKCKVLADIKVASFEELYKLMPQYQVLFCVIDANPERRKAHEFAQKFFGHVNLCFYNRGMGDKKLSKQNQEDLIIAVDRTAWLDLALGRFKSGSIQIPKDISEEYRTHIKTPVRIYEKDNFGNPVGRYVGGDNDHFAHARTYAEIALPLAASISTSKDVRGFL